MIGGAIILGITYLFFACMTGMLLAQHEITKRPWLVLLISWIWPITWLIGVLSLPYVIFRHETNKQS